VGPPVGRRLRAGGWSPGLVARLDHAPSVADEPDLCPVVPAPLATASLAGRVDLFLEGCQGAGLALAAGALGGAVAGAARLGDGPAVGVGAIGVIGGALLFGASLSEADHPAWPGWLLGATGAALAFAILRGVVAGAARRAGEAGSSAAIALIVVVSALALAGLSLVISPVAIVALLGLGWLAVARRRRAQRKYEGLRVLR
jgi:hypothetical protein